MNALSRKIKHAGKLTSAQRSKLSSLYGEGIANAEAEEEVLRKGLVTYIEKKINLIEKLISSNISEQALSH